MSESDEERRQDLRVGITPEMRKRARESADPFQSLVDDLAAAMRKEPRRYWNEDWPQEDRDPSH